MSYSDRNASGEMRHWGGTLCGYSPTVIYARFKSHTVSRCRGSRVSRFKKASIARREPFCSVCVPVLSMGNRHDAARWLSTQFCCSPRRSAATPMAPCSLAASSARSTPGTTESGSDASVACRASNSTSASSLAPACTSWFASRVRSENLASGSWVSASIFRSTGMRWGWLVPNTMVPACARFTASAALAMAARRSAMARLPAATLVDGRS